MKKTVEFVPGRFYSAGYSREQALESVGAGWAPLVHKIFDEKEKYPHIVIDQVKEKWGGLRVYSAPMHAEFDKFVADVGRQSFYICEVCGNVGTLRGGGFYQTLCVDHAGSRPSIEPFQQKII